MNESLSTRTLGPNWVWISALAVVAAAAYFIGGDMDPSRATVPIWVIDSVRIAIVAIPAVLLVWLLSVRLTIDPLGLRCQSLLGEKEMRWDEVDELYSGGVRTLLYGFLPVGTRYSFRMRAGVSAEQRIETVRQMGKARFTFTQVKEGTGAREVSFGSRFSDAKKIHTLLNELTFPHLWRKVSERYDAGSDVEFGDFVLSIRGLKVNLLGMFPEMTGTPIAWEDISSYSVKDGSFNVVYLSRGGKPNLASASRPVAQIPNFQVMLSLLNQLKPFPATR